ncbi:peptidoglycan DD-metalloendopeptidase family protein [Terracoccus luteus]|uniref:Murein DD-endopeptidase MepM/ murein hydrolase activator NlpD n=1 Tax=Terracoccus luteus TaxID=53356 RepID=A0A839PQW1_9MICO|nr:peptidoglycan DD-metalloendopeptidase family protein [Terracoccus luteus]MBB2985224.1 murein DD-endopeptidase MepM/ murein hydrolase activator NlpD [Terracoccus luteus]MCP2170876.1 murein DD-endopeptidase MepM/ murein hydrolase activator NlpD [Terracoccus luteus]
MSLVSSLAAAVLSVAALLTPAPLAAEAPAPARGWTWPLAPQPSVVRGFDPPDRPWLAGHRGVDLSARVGQPVRVPTGGEVTYSGRLAGRGVVVVGHEGGLRSTFEPVTAGPPVGTAVARGDPVGTVEPVAGHCPPATCLHWGVRRGDTYLDPLALIGARPVVLLPLR